MIYARLNAAETQAVALMTEKTRIAVLNAACSGLATQGTGAEAVNVMSSSKCHVKHGGRQDEGGEVKVARKYGEAAEKNETASLV